MFWKTAEMSYKNSNSAQLQRQDKVLAFSRLGFLVCEFYFCIVSSSCRHQSHCHREGLSAHEREKRAETEQGKCSLLPVIIIQCCRVEDCEIRQQEQPAPRCRCIVYKPHLMSGPPPSAPLRLLGAVSVVWLCDRLLRVAQATDVGR